MKQHRFTLVKGALGLLAWSGLSVAHALPSYTPITLNDPTPQEFVTFGRSVAGIGDVNGDARADVLVGAPGQTVSGNNFQGQAFVFSGANGKRLYTLNNPTPQAEAGFGFSVAGIGDVNGDKVSDVLVGAPYQDVSGNDSQGQAFVFSGATGRRLYTLNTSRPQELVTFGFSVAGVRDVNEDGISDLLVGAPNQDVGGNVDQGQVFVFSGATGQRLYTLNNPTPQAGAGFGLSVAGAGDVNGDGMPDLLVGAGIPSISGGNYGPGQAFVFSGATGGLLRTLNNPKPQAEAGFGSSVAGIGDVNGDARADVLVGAPGQTVSGNNLQGQAFVFSGATGGLLRALNTPRPQAFASFGSSVARIGDVNSDEAPDVLVGASGQDVGDNVGQGQTFMFSGATGRRLYTFNNPRSQAGSSFGSSVARAGDVNRDGMPDLLVGAFLQDVGGNIFQGQAFLFVSGPARPRWVALNILPERINLKTQDVLPVAILTTSKFNATQVNPLSVRLGPGQAQELHRQGHQRDVDGDGDKDLVLHFRTQAIGLGCGEQAVKLTGQTVAGQAIQGVDRLVVVGCQ